ncbi:MAG: ANTAR domain-containing protein [Lachnospiraceae bacterium]|jgi:response regulator NasT|nr:ANTAR domain-containing protein [Lachnospiraceae bacterium]
MPKTEDIQHSVLIVSASEQFDAIVKKTVKHYLTIDVKRSCALGRRSLLEKQYDLVLIQGPLQDESGEEFAMDVADQGGASVLLVAPQDVFEDVLEKVTDSGILVVPYPSPPGRIEKAIRLMIAIQNKMHLLRQKVQSVEEKMAELKTISRAKILLMEKKGMTEEEAHRFIGKQAMNAGVSRGYMAEEIIEDLQF